MVGRLLSKALQVLPDRQRHRLKARIRGLARSGTSTRGLLHELDWPNGTAPAPTGPTSAGNGDSSNPLRQYFEAHRQGPGIWKWRHYFDVYHRHLAKFVGKPVGVLEVGIFSGGSLGMWRSYFGSGCRMYGVDIEPACKAYEGEGVQVFIGDQADRQFWRGFRSQVPPLDVVIDDGGHEPHQQIATLEEVLPHLRPGGVYICEDVHQEFNRFMDYMGGVVNKLNAVNLRQSDPVTSVATPFQSAVHSVHFYPYVVVVERNDTAPGEFMAPRHGTEWQPFLSTDGVRRPA